MKMIKSPNSTRDGKWGRELMDRELIKFWVDRELKKHVKWAELAK
jgi:hypothetical protein